MTTYSAHCFGKFWGLLFMVVWWMPCDHWGCLHTVTGSGEVYNFWRLAHHPVWRSVSLMQYSIEEECKQGRRDDWKSSIKRELEHEEVRGTLQRGSYIQLGWSTVVTCMNHFSARHATAGRDHVVISGTPCCDLRDMKLAARPILGSLKYFCWHNILQIVIYNCKLQTNLWLDRPKLWRPWIVLVTICLTRPRGVCAQIQQRSRSLLS